MSAIVDLCSPKKTLCYLSRPEGLLADLTRPSVDLKRSAICLREYAVGIKIPLPI